MLVDAMIRNFIETEKRLAPSHTDEYNDWINRLDTDAAFKADVISIYAAEIGQGHFDRRLREICSEHSMKMTQGGKTNV